MYPPGRVVNVDKINWDENGDPNVGTPSHDLNSIPSTEVAVVAQELKFNDTFIDQKYGGPDAIRQAQIQAYLDGCILCHLLPIPCPIDWIVG